MKLKTYIFKNRKITITKAADELGVSRPYLSDVVNGKLGAGKKLAQKIEKWSGGCVSAIEAMYP